MPSPSQQRAVDAERHRAYLKRRDLELGLADSADAIRGALGYESAVPALQDDWTPPRRAGQRPLTGWAARGMAHQSAVPAHRRMAPQPDWWTAAVAATVVAVAGEKSVA
jgi:hypothetical protein